MEINLWFFLTVTTVFVTLFLIILVTNINKNKMKTLEVEALKIQKANLKSEVEEAVNNRIGDLQGRIEVIEAIVSDKNYELNEKITRLK